MSDFNYLPQSRVYEYNPYIKEFKYPFGDYVEEVSDLIDGMTLDKKYYIFYLDNFRIRYTIFDDIIKFSIKNHGFKIMEYCSLYDNFVTELIHIVSKKIFNSYIKTDIVDFNSFYYSCEKKI